MIEFDNRIESKPKIGIDWRHRDLKPLNSISNFVFKNYYHFDEKIAVWHTIGIYSFIFVFWEFAN